MPKKFKTHAQSMSFLWRDIGSFYFTEKLYMTWGCVILARWGSLAEKVHNSCLVHIFLIESHWKFFKLLTTKIAYDLRVCHDLDLKLFGNGQGHWQKKIFIWKIRVRSISFIFNSLEDCLWPEGMLWSWPTGKFKVIVLKMLNFYMCHVFYELKW